MGHPVTEPLIKTRQTSQLLSYSHLGTSPVALNLLVFLLQMLDPSTVYLVCFAEVEELQFEKLCDLVIGLGEASSNFIAEHHVKDIFRSLHFQCLITRLQIKKDLRI